MKPQYEHRLLSSLRLFLDHRLAQSGEAFFNADLNFYPTQSGRKGEYSYACPMRGLVNDASILGVTVMSGAYVSGILTQPGARGMIGINHYKGTIDFSCPINGSISGFGSVKEINVELTTKKEDELIFDTKYVQHPRFTQAATGFPIDSLTVPSVFLVKKESHSKPFVLGGSDLSVMTVRAVVIADSEYMLDGIGSILKDTHYRRVHLIDSVPSDRPEFAYAPFDSRGRYVNGGGSYYNYTGIVSGETSRNGPLIQKVSESRITNSDPSLKIRLYSSFVDFEISSVRAH